MESQGVAENFATNEKKNRGKKKKETDDFIFALVFILLQVCGGSSNLCKK